MSNPASNVQCSQICNTVDETTSQYNCRYCAEDKPSPISLE